MEALARLLVGPLVALGGGPLLRGLGGRGAGLQAGVAGLVNRQAPVGGAVGLALELGGRVCLLCVCENW